MSKKLLIIDDEKNMRHMLKAMLTRNGYQVDIAENGAEACKIVREKQYDYILCDVRMPEMDGMEFLDRSEPYLQDSILIMMSAYGTVDLALKAIKKGAYDYISKPFKADEVLLTLKKAEERETLKNENLILKKKLQESRSNMEFDQMVGPSEPMKKIFALARRIASYDTTILITGESGTGKELLARGIHSVSPRKRREFLAVNCASIPEQLLESELFGFAKGAFTGADKTKKGLFAEADKSTLFLDEIGELPLAMQVKLLRVLQEGEIRPVGTNRQIQVDVRILAATSRDLQQEVEQGTFREDLYYRLNVIHMPIPPLRSRLTDIPHLCHHFIEKLNARMNLHVKAISNEALSLLLQYAWPGNVRELENVIERAMILARTQTICPEDLPDSIYGEQMDRQDDDHRVGFSLKKAQASLEADMIRKALDATAGNKSKAAELLELSYPSLLGKIKKYNIH